VQGVHNTRKECIGQVKFDSELEGKYGETLQRFGAKSAQCLQGVSRLGVKSKSEAQER
jgi:hypothetical protein